MKHGKETMEFHLDSSTLIKVVHEDKLQALIRVARERGANLYVASPVIDELLAGDNDSYLRSVTKVLLALFDSGCFRISPGLEPVLRQELREPVLETPIVSKDFRRNYRNGLRQLVGHPRPTSLLDELRQRQGKMKGPWGPADATISEAIKAQLKAQGMRANDIGVELAQLNPATLPSWLLELVLHRLLARTDVPTSQILEQPGRYPFLVAWTGLVFLWVAALGVPAEHRTQHPILSALRTNRNDYLDAQIAAEAARAAILVAEDKGLIDRCELLRARGCIQFHSMDLDAFLRVKQRTLN